MYVSVLWMGKVMAISSAEASLPFSMFPGRQPVWPLTSAPKKRSSAFIRLPTALVTGTLGRTASSGLDIPGAVFTFASGINAEGDVVGKYKTADGLFHGFLLAEKRIRQQPGKDLAGCSTDPRRSKSTPCQARKSIPTSRKRGCAALIYWREIPFPPSNRR